ncbi:MAG TPA: transglycosylase SLT domain-containing protein [Ilumatobacteraceae bacterium]|nr:transglycosylase SLT domain-containing protein [Ilumatobacteraceae bacterium]
MSAITAMASVQARIASIESRFGAPPAPRARATTIDTAPAIEHTTSPMSAGAPDGDAFTEVYARAIGNEAALMPASSPLTGGGVVPPGTPYAAEFVAAGERHGISPTILAAVGFVESSYRPDAVSSAGAIGLMQLMPATAASLGVDATDPVSAIDGAARLLSSFRDRFGSIELALAAYNVGPGTIANSGGIAPGSQAEKYVNKVLSTEQGMR